MSTKIESLGRVSNCAFIVYTRLVYGKPILADNLDKSDRREIKKLAKMIEHWTNASAYYWAVESLLNSTDYCDDSRPLMNALRQAHGQQTPTTLRAMERES